MTVTIELTALQAAEVCRQAHASMALAAAAASDGDATGQALARFDQFRSVAKQLDGLDGEAGATITVPAEVAMELAEWVLHSAGKELGAVCQRDPVALPDVDRELERVASIRDLVAILQPQLDHAGV
jgi:hypothetical protein